MMAVIWTGSVVGIAIAVGWAGGSTTHFDDVPSRLGERKVWICT